MWEAYYPLGDLDQARKELIGMLEATLPAFVSLLVHHRPKTLRGHSIAEVLSVNERTPERLGALWRQCKQSSRQIRQLRPTLAFALIGQARMDGRSLLSRRAGWWQICSRGGRCEARSTCRNSVLRRPAPG